MEHSSYYFNEHTLCLPQCTLGPGSSEAKPRRRCYNSPNVITMRLCAFLSHKGFRYTGKISGDVSLFEHQTAHIGFQKLDRVFLNEQVELQI